MKLFTTYTYSWLELSIFKVALLLIGALVGAYYSEFVLTNVVLLSVIAAVTSVYIMYVSWPQMFLDNTANSNSQSQ